MKNTAKKNVLRRNISALLIVFVLMFTGLIVYLGYVNVIVRGAVVRDALQPAHTEHRKRTSRRAIYSTGRGASCCIPKATSAST